MRWKPKVKVPTHLSGMRSPSHYPMAAERLRWAGEPVVMVLAEARAQAEDTLALLVVEYEVLPAVTDVDGALEPGSPRIHDALDSNLCPERNLHVVHVDAAWAAPGVTLVGRHVISSPTLYGLGGASEPPWLRVS